MKLIPLTQGQFAIIDDEWFEELIKYKWHARWSPDAGTFYATRNIKIRTGVRRTIQMHRVILNAPKGIKVDHRDGVGTNNLLTNIRLAPGNGNDYNRGKNSNNSSGFKGVTWDNYSKKWKANIMVNRRQKSLGRHLHILNAALAYNEAALKIHGEFAYQNPIWGK